MGSSIAGGDPGSSALAGDDQNDPFLSTSPAPDKEVPRHRFSNFDSSVFALGPNASPTQARRALEAHLAETDRRMEEAGKLGTSLVQQRMELEERLKEVEKQQNDGELSQELKEKLIGIEKEYNEVARESARAFLPKNRVPSNEAAAGSPFVPEGNRSGRRSVSPSKFEAHATASPTKLSVPNRKVRNQPTNRMHDIEFAAEISTSLITQVRNLQQLLAEREAELRDVRIEKSKLEYDAEGFQQRMKSMDESESHYKDENWSLETQVNDLKQTVSEYNDREKKLHHTINLVEAEKNSAQRELDDVKLSHSKLAEEHAAIVKNHDVELGAAKRNIAMAESDRTMLHRKIEELTGQNHELAKAISSQRSRFSDRPDALGIGEEGFETARDGGTPDHSPPPSPVKHTPRHSMLESETLKTSLHHAQRTIQSLRTNVHREKTEKIELRRMLQDARDELEKARQEPAAGNRRSKKAEARERRISAHLLGSVRSTRSEIFLEDPEWEDHPEHSPGMSSSSRNRGSGPVETVLESTEMDHFQTAQETSEAFETANERENETDDFQTGAEDLSSSDDDEDAMTETDSPSKLRTLRGRPPSMSGGALRRSESLHSTASTDDDDYEFEDTRTPSSQLSLHHHKFPLRVGRGVLQRSRQASEEPGMQSSPISLVNSSAAGTPQQHVQSLAAELGDFAGSDNESNLSATPSRRSIRTSRPGSMRGMTATPPPPMPMLPRVIMIDSGTMTEPVSQLSSQLSTTSFATGVERPRSMHTVIGHGDSFGSEPSVKNKDSGEFPVGRAIQVEDEMSDVASLNDAHAAELRALQENHGEEIQQLRMENQTSRKAALDALAAKHQEQLTSLETTHMEQLRNTKTELSENHIRDIDSLKGHHSAQVEQLRQSYDALRVAHNEEIDALKKSHLAQIQEIQSKISNTHGRELKNIKEAHVGELGALRNQHDEVLAAERNALLAAHTAELQASKAESDARLVQELETLKAEHARQIDSTRAESEVASAAAVEALKVDHAREMDMTKAEGVAASAAAIEAIKATHGRELASTKADGEMTSAKAIEGLKVNHARDLEATKADGEAASARALEALKATHARELASTKTDGGAASTRALETLKATHAQELASIKADSEAASARAIEALGATHAHDLASTKAGREAAFATETDALKATHARELELTKADGETNHKQALQDLRSSHEREVENLHKQKDREHTANLAALATAHKTAMDSLQSDSTERSARDVAALKDNHAHELETLRAEHASARSRELDGFKTALANQMASSKVEGDAAHSKQIEALNVAHTEILEAHKRDSENALTQALEASKAAHAKEIEVFRSQNAATKSKDLESLTIKHHEELEALKTSLHSTHATELAALSSQHQDEKSSFANELQMSKLKELAHMASDHDREVQRLKTETGTARMREVEELTASHTRETEAVKAKISSSKAKELEDLQTTHSQELEALREEHRTALSKLSSDLLARHARQTEESQFKHSQELETHRAKSSALREKELEDLRIHHSQVLDSLREEHRGDITKLSTDTTAAHARELEELHSRHSRELEAHKSHASATRSKELEEHTSEHAVVFARLRSEHQENLDRTIHELNDKHANQLASFHKEFEATCTGHGLELRNVQAQHERLSKDLEAKHAAELEKLVARHALELESLRNSLAVKRPTLGMSRTHSVETAPVEEPEVRRPRKESLNQTRTALPVDDPFVSKGKSKGKDAAVPYIAEDETRQSPSSVNGPETPESQRPFKEISTNADARATRKQTLPTSDHSCQTALTSDGIDRLLSKGQRRRSRESMALSPSRVAAVVASPEDETTPSTVRHQRPSENASSLGSPVKSRVRTGDAGVLSAPEPIPSRRPGSSASFRGLDQELPPLPPNHKEAIEAARTGSSNGHRGAMGPPPAPVFRNANRPRTPLDNRPMSPSSLRHTPTPRAGTSNSRQGFTDVNSFARVSMRSRQSSISSFASEIESRFNRADLGMEVAGFVGPSTDPRMIQAITQTMIGEYLWKYTRKAGRGDMSENRHRRYFWVHPYTRTLYWSDRDPSSAGRSEQRNKSVPIEAVRVVTDDNPMPPGLHRKSLVIISPGRVIKFTCTTGQRHETWFNALSYLLLRTGNEGQADTEEMAGHFTQEDVDEFNPGHGQRPADGTRSRAVPSLSSYHSRTTRNESPAMDMSMNVPTLTPTRDRNTMRSGTLGRLSGYWRGSNPNNGGIFHSLRGRSQPPSSTHSAIYEASEVPDSAEDVRVMMERQEREADRLENVRACCDGKHDVGTLAHSKRGRFGHSQSHHHHSHAHPGPSTTPTPGSTIKGRA